MFGSRGPTLGPTSSLSSIPNLSNQVVHPPLGISRVPEVRELSRAVGKGFREGLRNAAVAYVSGSNTLGNPISNYAVHPSEVAAESASFSAQPPRYQGKTRRNGKPNGRTREGREYYRGTIGAGTSINFTGRTRRNGNPNGRTKEGREYYSAALRGRGNSRLVDWRHINTHQHSTIRSRSRLQRHSSRSRNKKASTEMH